MTTLSCFIRKFHLGIARCMQEQEQFGESGLDFPHLYHVILFSSWVLFQKNVCIVPSDDIAALRILDSRSLIPFTSVEKTTHCSAFVLLDSGVHEINFAIDNNNFTCILTLLCDLKSPFLET